jgi:DNA-binding CsgD family transcriptional regulator
LESVDLTTEANIEHARRVLLEAMVDIDRWETALDAVSLACGARTGQLVSVDGARGVAGHWLSGAPDGFLAEMEAFDFTNPKVNPRFVAGMTAPLLTPVADQDYADVNLRQSSPIYRAVFDPYDLPFNCQVVLVRSKAALVRTSVTRSRKQGPLDEAAIRAFRALIPHMHAAVRVQHELALNSQRSSLRSLDAVGAVALYLDEALRVVAMSSAAAEMLNAAKIIRLSSNQLKFSAGPDQDAFATTAGKLLLSIKARSAAAPAPTLMPVCRMVLDLQPLPRERFSLPGSSAILAVLRPARPKERGPMLRLAFRLSAAEASIALALGDGASLEEIATERGVSIATVRSQVQAVYAKIDVHHQGALAALVRRLSEA